MRPKETAIFEKIFPWDEFQWDNFYFDSNENNAVIEHQLHQAGKPTSGISTTPKIERAKFYATDGGKLNSGLLYVICPKLCEKHNVKMYKVAEIVPNPSVPEDEEIILVASDFGEIPIAVRVEVISFPTII